MSDGLRGPGLLQACGTLDARNVVGVKGLPLRAPGPEIRGEFVERILSAGSEWKAENSQEEEGSFHECAILRDKAGEVNVNAGSSGKCRVEGARHPRKPQDPDGQHRRVGTQELMRLRYSDTCIPQSAGVASGLSSCPHMFGGRDSHFSMAR